MAKKIMILSILGIIGLIVCFVAFNVRTTKTIPLMNSFYFGMTPREVTQQLGETFDIQHDVGSTGKTTYSYKIPVLEYEANVIFFFLDNERLTEVDIIWSTSSDDLYDRVHNVLYEFYSKSDQFFSKEHQNNDDSNVTTSLGIDDGTTGVYYSISRTDSSIIILCVDNS